MGAEEHDIVARVTSGASNSTGALAAHLVTDLIIDEGAVRELLRGGAKAIA